MKPAVAVFVVRVIDVRQRRRPGPEVAVPVEMTLRAASLNSRALLFPDSTHGCIRDIAYNVSCFARR